MTRDAAALLLFSLALFASAAALFSVQPLAGKMLLPLVGGAPSGWVVAMAFFQVMLLAGYFVAHLLARLEPRLHLLAYLAAMGAGALFLPPALEYAGEGTPGAGAVFLMLALGLGLPFAALSATSSTLQRLFAVTGHPAAKDPYFLYAASNLGSFAGLLLYPFAIEPFFPLTAQGRGWLWLYGGVMALSALCLAFAKPGMEAPAAKSAAAPRKRVAQWIILSFLPSSLLLGLTTMITTDIISAPFVWVGPLAVYLLAFAAAFARRPPVSLARARWLLPLALTLSVVVPFFQPPVTNMNLGGMGVLLACFGVLALYCALRLSELRPASGLTQFYLAIAAGGALGGLFNAFIAPFIFDRPLEYILCLLALTLLEKGPETRTGKAVIGLMAAIFLFSFLPPPTTDLSLLARRLLLLGCNALLALAAAVVWAVGPLRRRFLYPALACLFIGSQFLIPREDLIDSDRNFFGAIRVLEADAMPGDGRVRYIMHGTTLHGFQLPLKEKNADTSYYSPLGRVIETYAPKNVAVIGLGAGTLNCFSAPDRAFTFIEIDPAMIEMAQKHFTYLTACPGARPPRLVTGDGRLELARMKDEKFDLIVLDAFSSDAIPTHLLTREAVREYIDHLTPDGVLAFHVTNRYFSLERAVAATVEAEGLGHRMLVGGAGPSTPYAMSSTWIIAARPRTGLYQLDEFNAIALYPRESDKPWTDEYTNLLRTLLEK